MFEIEPDETFELPVAERPAWFLNLEAAARALAEIVVNYDLATAMDDFTEGEPQSVWSLVLADQSLLKEATSDILYCFTTPEDGHDND